MSDYGDENLNPMLTCIVNGHQIDGLVDSGAHKSIMSLDFISEMGLLDQIVPTNFVFRCANGATVDPVGKITTYVVINGQNYPPFEFTIIDNFKLDLLLGMDFGKKTNMHLEFSTAKVSFPGTDCPDEAIAFIAIPARRRARAQRPPAANRQVPLRLLQASRRSGPSRQR